MRRESLVSGLWSILREKKKTILLPQSSQIIPSSFIFWRQFIWLVNQCGNSGTTHKPWTLDLTSYQQTQSCTEWSTVPAGVFFFFHILKLCAASHTLSKKKKNKWMLPLWSPGRLPCTPAARPESPWRPSARCRPAPTPLARRLWAGHLWQTYRRTNQE